MLQAIVNHFKKMRDKIYHFFPHRRDAAMELVDAISSNTTARSVVELSLNPFHRRNYCSITRVLGEFYEGSDPKQKQEKNKELIKLLSESCSSVKNKPYHVFALDCTPNPRQFSRTLADRGFVYAPTVISGNKPITIGHQYSVVAYLPEKLSKDTPPWIVPLSCERVGTEQKGVVIGMQQMGVCLSQEPFQSKLCISVGDCAYSHPNCITEAAKNPNQLHVTRVRNNRTLYYSPQKIKRTKKKGRPLLYGKKFKLNKLRRKKTVDENIDFEIFNKKGKTQMVKVESWNDVLMRGDRKSDMSRYPFRLLKIQVYNSSGTLLFKRAMWLIVSGEKRNQLSLREVYDIYRQRFDIEHFFRFGKDRLLMDKIQTPEVEHEEAWWQFVMIAYTQLYLGREVAQSMPNAWEKYLPTFQSSAGEKSPTQVQKDFIRIINEIGTPAKPPILRNKSHGRSKGEVQIKRSYHKVILKNKKSEKFSVMAA